MPTLTIRRNQEPFNFWPAYHLFVDGKNIGKIGRGQMMSIEVPIGEHHIKAQIATAKTPDFTLNISSARILEIKNNSRLRRLLLPLLAINTMSLIGMRSKVVTGNPFLLALAGAFALFFLVFLVYYYFSSNRLKIEEV